MALGDLIYRGATVWLRLVGNTTTTRKFLTQTGNGSVSAAPSWQAIATTDLGTGTADNTTFLRGDLTWATPSGSGGAPTGASYVTLGTDGTLTAERVLTGTANQITVTDNGAGSTVVLSTPQNLHTSATPQFARMGIGAAADGTAELRIAGHYWADEVDAGNSGTSKTLDWNDGNTQKLTLTGNVTLTLSNPKAGGRYLLILVQDGTGSRTVTWPSSVKWSGGAAPTLSTGAGDVDIVTLAYTSALSGAYLSAANMDFS